MLTFLRAIAFLPFFDLDDPINHSKRKSMGQVFQNLIFFHEFNYKS